MHRMLVDLPDGIETERLRLRPYRAGDGREYQDLCLRNKEHLLPYEQGNPALNVNTEEDAEILVRQFAADWAARNAFFLGAWEKATGELVGQIYIGPVDWDLPEFAIGYWVDESHEGQGYITEAVRATAKMLFEDLGACRVRIGTNETNARSWRVAERCGFVREAHIRGTRKHVKLENGNYSGDYWYGMLRDEYEAQSQK